MNDNLMIQFDSDDLIYNRYDIIFSYFEKVIYAYEGKQYFLMLYRKNEKAYINLWGKKLPQCIFEKLIDDILDDKNVTRISLIRCRNNYKGMLEETNDIRIHIPETVSELTGRLKAKHRFNLNRNKRQIEEALGAIHTKHCVKHEITDDIVNLYFLWKRISHGAEYGMSPKEYLDTYYVTDAIVVTAGDRIIGIAFYCIVNDTAYFENSSFDQEYSKFSAGYITYELLLEQLIVQGIRLFYLGGGKYEYKRRFDAEESIAYSGHIYSGRILKRADAYLEKLAVNSVVIYGLGKYGHEFIRLYELGFFNIQLVGAIDRNKEEVAGINTYTAEEIPPDADAAIITMKNRNEMVEGLLGEKYKHVIYMNDLLNK